MALSLSALAGALLDESLKLAEATLDGVERPSNTELGIIAYGKLGSEELGYHSDLDIVFVFDESSESENTELSARRHYYRRLVQEHWAKHRRGEKLIMSFHGTPQRYSDQGDPYYEQCHATAKALADRLALNPDEWMLTFQSRFGLCR